MTQDARIPVTILTGFLGSGKTTLLNRMLADPLFADSAVIINEFGAVSIDHLLVATPRDNIFVLDSGCVCCSVQGELVDTLLALYAQRAAGAIPAFRRVLVETTGLADPLPLVETFAVHPEISAHYALHSIVTLVDAVNGLDQLDEFREARHQAAVADRIVVSKTDLAAPDARAALAERLEALNCGAARTEVDARAAAPAELLGTEFFDLAHGHGELNAWLRASHRRQSGAYERHGEGIQSFSVRHCEPVTRAGLVLWLDMLAGIKGRDLLRVKGIFNVSGDPVVVHAVQRVVHPPAALAAWPDADRATRIVFITRGIARAGIEKTLQVLGYVAPQLNRNLLDPEAYARFVSAVGKFY